MDTSTAIAHLEAYISGGDELGDVSEADALEALRFLQINNQLLADHLNRVLDREKILKTEIIRLWQTVDNPKSSSNVDCTNLTASVYSDADLAEITTWYYKDEGNK